MIFCTEDDREASGEILRTFVMCLFKWSPAVAQAVTHSHMFHTPSDHVCPRCTVSLTNLQLCNITATLQPRADLTTIHLFYFQEINLLCYRSIKRRSTKWTLFLIIYHILAFSCMWISVNMVTVHCFSVSVPLYIPFQPLWTSPPALISSRWAPWSEVRYTRVFSLSLSLSRVCMIWPENRHKARVCVRKCFC